MAHLSTQAPQDASPTAEQAGVRDDGFGAQSPKSENGDGGSALKSLARLIRDGSFSLKRGISPVAAPMLAGGASAARCNQPSMSSDDLARLAHELKTPLTAIAAAAEIMRDERLGDMGNTRYLDYARDIHESAAHALAVIARLLAQGDAREAERDRIEAIDLNDLVARTVATLQPIAAERDITLAFDADDGNPVVSASATAVRQILLNLLSNALKFTPAGGDVRAVTGYLPNGAVFLVVRDSGEGIAELIIRNALAFADGAIAERPGGGYGIGLPLVCRLVADMGARIEFDSEPGQGSVVLISF
jgi:two-component system cell cycle sensor histidine kinase PleC